MTKKSTQERGTIWRCSLDRYDCAALIVGLFAFSIWINLLAWKYNAFGYYDWDLAIYAQLMWSLCHGSMSPSLMSINFLGNHTEYIAFLLVPVYFVFQHPLTLIVLKILSFVAGAYVLYRLSRESVRPGFALVFMGLYLIFPANVFAMLYEFHFETLAIGPLFLMYYFFRKDNLKAYLWTAVLLSLIKENMPLIVCAFGIYGLVAKRHKIAWGVVPALWGLTVFCVSVFVVTPLFREGMNLPHQYIALYPSLGKTIPQIVMSIFVNPLEILRILAQPHKWSFLGDLFGPLGPVAILSPHVLFLASPVLLIHLLSSVGRQQMIYFHYTATIVPFIFMATLATFQFIAKKGNKFLSGTLMIALTASCLAFVGFHFNDIQRRILLIKDDLDSYRGEMIKSIPPKAGVMATFGFLPELSQRELLISFRNVLTGYNGLSFRPFKVPEDVSYVLVDFEDMWIRDALYQKPAETLAKMRDFFNSGWSVKMAAGEIALLEKTPGIESELIGKQLGPWPGTPLEKHILVDGKFRLVGLEFDSEPLPRSSVLPITFHWQVEADMGEDYLMTLAVKSGPRATFVKRRRIGYTIYPTREWKKGDRFTERYWLPLPKLPAGKYVLEISFGKLGEEQPVALSYCDPAGVSNGDGDSCPSAQAEENYFVAHVAVLEIK